ncbi:MAG TPA: FAD-dependent oxidoreductase, partial [Vicinamibacterales bacterium]|nr:FAD-dependent oxidoreductase [Vicinamibacterales bacterium]
MLRRTDFLIIGSGIAGLRAAADLALAGDVLILTKADPTESNTGYAQGGIAAAVGDGDAPAHHAADTIAAGDGLCVEAAVGVLAEEGVRYVHELVEWGARFDRDVHGRLALGREGAHGRRRVLHAADATGREIGRALWERVSDLARVRVERNTRVHELIVRADRCIG